MINRLSRLQQRKLLRRHKEQKAKQLYGFYEDDGLKLGEIPEGKEPVILEFDEESFGEFVAKNAEGWDEVLEINPKNPGTQTGKTRY